VQRVLIVLTLAVTTALAQNTGRLSGVISDPEGKGVPRFSVEAKNTVTGKVFETVTSGAGEYSIPKLPAGTYDVSVLHVYYMQPYQKKGVSVGSGETVRIDAKLEYRLMGGTPGEGHEAYLSSLRRIPPQGRTPRTREGKPDLSGVWSMPIPNFEGELDALPAGAPTGEVRPSTLCLPHSVFWQYSYLKLVQTPNLLVILFDDEDPNFRQIFLDGRPHPKDANPTWYGHSTGHWEGDTLVVDRTGFNDRSWLDNNGHRHSENLHVVERYRRPDLGHLEVETTMEDPDTLKRPWVMKTVSVLAPGEDVQEYACNENNIDPPHMRN
jgi:hypothetical protein